MATKLSAAIVATTNELYSQLHIVKQFRIRKIAQSEQVGDTFSVFAFDRLVAQKRSP